MVSYLFKAGLILLMSVAALGVAAVYDAGDSDLEKGKEHKWDDKAGWNKTDEPLAVEIDIEKDSLDLTDKEDLESGVLEIVILGSEDFDVNHIDPSSLSIGNVDGAEKFMVFDQNNDGIEDLVAGFSISDLNLKEGAQELTLKGKTKDGKMFKGRDQITVTKAY